MVSSEVVQPHVVLELPHVQEPLVVDKSVVLELFVIELFPGACVIDGVVLAFRFPPEVVVVTALKK